MTLRLVLVLVLQALLVAFLFLLVSGCATTDPLQVERARLRAERAQAIADLRTFTVEDLRAAGVQAAANGHQAGAVCWPVLADLVAATPKASPILGVATLVETVYLANHAAPNEALVVACAALGLQVTRDIVEADLAAVKAYNTSGLSLVKDLPKLIRVFTAILQGLP